MNDNTDPVVRTARREALLVVGIWLVAIIYSISTCYWLGYNRPAAEAKLVWGFPDWIFWGVVAPWVICSGIAWAFGARFVHDSHLGEELPEETDELGLGS